MASQYWGIVDMGSNGIRCSITDLAPETARILPAIYQDRMPISLYDAQWSDGVKVPIPDNVIEKVCSGLKSFQETCRDFGVPESQVRVIATEATRVALNSQSFRDKIQQVTGWTVEMLPKEEEGRIGACGVASSFPSVCGLMMDLGGGSTQITWIRSQNGTVDMSPAGSISMPYGAAALLRRIQVARDEGGKADDKLSDEIGHELARAVREIAIPDDLQKAAKSEEGLTMYLSGGGFRGWGSICMSQHSTWPYPIAMVNGFRIGIDQFSNTKQVMNAVATNTNIFRVSERRSDQVPAVARLVKEVMKVVPGVKKIYFSQGGVREGALFANLSNEIRAEHPLVTATSKYATPSSPELTKLAFRALPSTSVSLLSDPNFNNSLVTAFVRSMYFHSTMNKDIQAASGLRSTTTGVLGNVHGAIHEERAALALMLCERWGGAGALSPGDEDFHRRVSSILSNEQAWWAMYIGAIGAIIGKCYPAGVIRSPQYRMDIDVAWDKEPVAPQVAHGHKDKHKKDQHTEDDSKRELNVKVSCAPEMLLSEIFAKSTKRLEKIGKTKNWPNGLGGHKINLTVEPMQTGGT